MAQRGDARCSNEKVKNDLRTNPRYPLEPDINYATSATNSELVIPNGPNNTYGGRFRAWLIPEETAIYEFFIRCDDQGELRLGLDDQFDLLEDPNTFPTAEDTSVGDTLQEPGLDLSTSLPVQLEKGQRYAIQLIWKEGNGNDYGQIAWRKFGDFTPADQLEPIPSRFFSYYGPGATPPPEAVISGISRQGGQVVIEWSGAALQSSENLNTWTDEAGAAAPFATTPSQAKRFYRARN